MSSRQQTAFYRKLYLAYLISQQRHNLLSLHQLTSMPRRTIQDTLADFDDIGLRLEFIQDGPRNNSGYYQLVDWGPIQAQWVRENLDHILAVLNQ